MASCYAAVTSPFISQKEVVMLVECMYLYTFGEVYVTCILLVYTWRSVCSLYFFFRVDLFAILSTLYLPM